MYMPRLAGSSHCNAIEAKRQIFYCAGKTSGSSFKPLNAFYFMQAQHAVHHIDNAMKRPLFPGQIQLDDIGTSLFQFPNKLSEAGIPDGKPL